jgi:hypothetical protein
VAGAAGVKLDTRMVIGLGIVGIALYLYLKPEARHAVQSAAEQTQAAFDRAAAQIRQDAQARELEGQQKTARILGTIGSTAATAGGAVAVGGSSAGTAAAATAGGIGTAGTIAITGGIGGAAVVAWGVIKKGWFRGGWEGIRGNEARDHFIDQFVYVYFPGAGTERQYDAMVRALSEIGIVGSGEPGSSTPNAGQMIRELYDADSENEMRAAMNHWRDVFAARGIDIAVPENFADF